MNGRKNVGPLGEELVVRFLMKRGFKILDRNFRRKWGELDVVAEYEGKIHFVEMKSTAFWRDTNGVTYETGDSPRHKMKELARPNHSEDIFRPEDHVHPQKLMRLGRVVQTYLMHKHVSDETPWQFDVATVHVNERAKQAKINFLEDLIL